MSEQRLPSYGGQALIEGVLMRGSKYVVASMRRPDGEIERVEEALGGIYKTKIRDIPVMRGLVILWDSLGLGLKYLTVSANVQTGEEEKIEKSEMVITLIISLAISILLFFVAPAWLGQLMKTKLGISQALSNIFEGLIRLLIVIGYMVLVSRMEEIKRVFRYHGAEHKTINAFDNGCQITIENVRAQSRLHPRCGTAFMVTVVLISIILFIIIGPLTLTMTSRLISRIILVPVISGIAYEYIRWNAKHLSNPIVKLLYYPNLAVQKITTAEPDDSMLECAISSFLRVLELENVKNETLTEANGEKKACVPVEKNTSL